MPVDQETRDLRQLAARFVDRERSRLQSVERSDILNSDLYPDLDRLSEPNLLLIEQCRACLAEDGLCVLPDFLTTSSLGIIRCELDALEGREYAAKSEHNAYFTPVDPELSLRHPVNTFSTTSNGFIAYDELGDTCLLKTIFFSPVFVEFIRQCVSEPQLHQFADPLTGLTVNVMGRGQKLGWHFDTPKFAVTLLVEKAEQGGVFEYVPNVRAVEYGDENFDEISEILHRPGHGSRKMVEINPGSLQILKGPKCDAPGNHSEEWGEENGDLQFRPRARKILSHEKVHGSVRSDRL